MITKLKQTNDSFLISITKIDLEHQVIKKIITNDLRYKLCDSGSFKFYKAIIYENGPFSPLVKMNSNTRVQTIRGNINFMR